MIPDAIRARLRSLHADELAAFGARTPMSALLHERGRAVMPSGVPMAWMAGLYEHLPPWVSHGDGPEFVDVDGNTYLDFNLADLSAPAGFTCQPVVRAVREQLDRGLQFLLPTEDAIVVSEHLAARFGLPKWQFTLSASTANMEAIRVARVITGRSHLVLFAGKYHGHIDDTLWSSVDGVTSPDLAGLPAQPAGPVTELEFNDVDAVRRRLALGDVAAVLVEPALTNCGVVMANDGFLEAVRDECTRTGTVMIVDETHTQMAMFGGLTRRLGLAPDMLTAGKGIGGGVPIGVYGMTESIAGRVEQLLDRGEPDVLGLALGGTLFANALALAAARAGLGEVFTEERHAEVERLGDRLADGIDAIVQGAGLPWRAHRLGARSGYCLEPELPTDAAGAARSLDRDFIGARRLYFANRGVWDAIWSAGPHAGFAHDASHIDRYLDVAAEFIAAITDRKVVHQ